MKLDDRFRLSEQFLEKYKKIKPPFGFDGLGELVYLRTYSRLKDNGENEVWWETVKRVVEGCFNMQRNWINQHGLGWNPRKAQTSAHEMFERIFNLKFLPPGRGLWAMGSPITEERGLFAALNNCAFVSTLNLREDLAKPFCFLMDMSMLGVGVGFDTKGAGQLIIRGDNKKEVFVYKIEDTRESWVESVKLLLESYFCGNSKVDFDYSFIRPEGALIKGFGGISSGPEPLKQCHLMIRGVLEKSIGKQISITTIVDIMNLIGKCVVSGNVRRSAEIVFGDYESEEYLDLKNYKINAYREDFGWNSNNSVFADLGMDYTNSAKRTSINGEPGYAWLENMRGYSRMNNGKDNKDHRVSGGNPCFRGDTLIAVADGRGAVSIKQLAEEGNDVPVYSVNKEGKVEIKWGRNPRITQTNVRELIEILLDDGSSFFVTPKHKMRLMDGRYVYAEDLEVNSSLPRFIKRSIKKDDLNTYLRVNCDTLCDKKEKIYEHRLIAKFFNLDKWNLIYDESKQNGLIKGVVVVHHKDYNSLNNNPSNLEIMTFENHAMFHGKHDYNGENNPMFGKCHSDKTKKLIGDKTRDQFKNKDFKDDWYEKTFSLENRKKYAESLRKTVNSNKVKFYKEVEKTTDLKTFWVEDRLYVNKNCKVCNKDLILFWSQRHIMTCSRACSNKLENGVFARANGIRLFFNNRQKDTLHNQITIFKNLTNILKRTPSQKEWEKECKKNNIPCRINAKGVGEYVLKSFSDLKERSKTYNHRVIAIKRLQVNENVYNLTVDDNYTVGIVTKFNKETMECDGIFTFQCLEQSLESYEMCCLVETFPYNHDSLDDFLVTLKCAYLYAKTVTLGKTHWPETNRVMLRNRRIGCSMSGIVQFINKSGIHILKEWCERGYEEIERYDTIYSDWFAIPKSIKKTSIKPSGTVSLLAGATPGVHFPENNYYIRRIRLAKTSNLVKYLEEAGYFIETCFGSEETTVVVEIPVKVGDDTLRTVDQVSMWEQLNLAAFMQRHWADNQVSCTVSFNKNEASQIIYALNYFQYQLKGISFLPRTEEGVYKQMPYEGITKDKYNELISKIKPLKFKRITNEHAEVEKFCNNDSCVLK